MIIPVLIENFCEHAPPIGGVKYLAMDNDGVQYYVTFKLI